MFVLAPVSVLIYMYGYQCMATCFPVSECNLIVNRWGLQTMRAYSSLSSIFLEIRKKKSFWILSLESITSTKINHKPGKGSLSSSQQFVTSPHLDRHESGSEFPLISGWFFFFFLNALKYRVASSLKTYENSGKGKGSMENPWKIRFCWKILEISDFVERNLGKQKNVLPNPSKFLFLEY